MKVINDKSGSQVESVNEYPIATATNIAEGTVVALSSNLVIAATNNQTTAILGVAKETHNGAADTLNTRANGLNILVSDSPTAIYEQAAPQITATSGTNILITATGLAAFQDSDFVGGKAKFITKAAASANTDPVGTVYAITASDGTNKGLTIAASGAVTAGDVFAIFPPIGFDRGELGTGSQAIVLTATTNSMAVKVVGMDTDRNKVKVEAALHTFGNKKA